jgi:SAM-dependent methyltransferase
MMPRQAATCGLALDPRQVEHNRVWLKKRTLRMLYADYHSRLKAACPEGPILDIGGGTAHVKETFPDVFSVDILPFPGIDAVCDAHCLAFADRHFSGIIMIDVLHHLEWPIGFLKEAARVLRPRGVLAMIEPAMTPLAYPFYRYFHQEPVDMRSDPFAPMLATSQRDPFDANQAIPSLLFKAANRQRLSELVPELTVSHVDWLSLFAFPLSGGFKRWCLIPSQLAAAVINLEDTLPMAVRRFFGFRIFTTLEKSE